MLRKVLFSAFMLATWLLLFSRVTVADKPQYDPTIHVYREGLAMGVMQDHVKYGTLASLIEGDPVGIADTETTKDGKPIMVPLFDLSTGVIPEFDESGSKFYPRAWPTDYRAIA